MAQYFENDENLKSEPIIIKVLINKEKYSFLVDNGVFSKKGLDFGTRTLLENINIKNKKVLDIGCGYGPIGIYLSKNNDVDLTDVNKRALSLAIKNLDLNKTKACVFESNLYENINKKYDIIISNPPIRVGKKILYDLLFQAKDYLNEDGKLFIVVNKNQGAKTVLRDLNEVYDAFVVKQHKGFYVICAEMR